MIVNDIESQFRFVSLFFFYSSPLISSNTCFRKTSCANPERNPWKSQKEFLKYLILEEISYRIPFENSAGISKRIIKDIQGWLPKGTSKNGKHLWKDPRGNPGTNTKNSQDSLKECLKEYQENKFLKNSLKNSWRIPTRDFWRNSNKNLCRNA